MKIMFVIARLDNQGPVNQLYCLLKELKNRDIDMEIVTLYSEFGDTRYFEFKELGIKIKSLHIKKKYKLLKAGKRLYNLVQLEKPDIIHSSTLPADLVVALSNVNRNKWCVTMHCNIYRDYFTRFRRIHAKLCIKAHEYVLKKAKKIICCSESICPPYIARIGGDIIVIKNGIDVSNIVEIFNLDKIELRRQLGLDLKKKIMIVVGSIDSRKNSLFITESYLNMKQDDVKLIFLGEGPDLESCRRIADGVIEFRGKVDNVPLYLRCSDLYISMSKSEGLPLSVIEAGCFGKKMILSDIDSHKEIVQEYKGSGVNLVAAKNTMDMARLLEKFVYEEGDEEYEISNYFVERFSSQRMSELYYKSYAEMIKEN